APTDDIPDGPEPDPEPEADPTAAPRRGTRPAPPAGSAGQQPTRPASEDDYDPDDPDLASSGLVGAPLVAQMLGGTVIDEIPDDPS
ncbi:hypothetical protein, partial [Actinotalea sp. C106]|uniref:hypothetical protein n=1 Tax=Actinotalea sp. C106 TaxID=2908644 RepID=UPI002029126C